MFPFNKKSQTADSKPNFPNLSSMRSQSQPGKGSLDSKVTDLEKRVTALEDQQKVPDMMNQPGQ